MSHSKKSHDIDPIKESNADSNEDSDSSSSSSSSSSDASPSGGESSPEPTRKRKVSKKKIGEKEKAEMQKKKDRRKRRLALQKKVGYKPRRRAQMLQRPPVPRGGFNVSTMYILGRSVRAVLPDTGEKVHSHWDQGLGPNIIMNEKIQSFTQLFWETLDAQHKKALGKY